MGKGIRVTSCCARSSGQDHRTFRMLCFKALQIVLLAFPRSIIDAVFSNIFSLYLLSTRRARVFSY